METVKIDEFLEYVDKEILPATRDLEKLEVRSRKHVQKLVYTNLVDRFDSLIDGLVLDNCRCDFLVTESTKGMGQQITEAELIKLLMRSGDLQGAIDEKLRTALRGSILRERHSRKLEKVFGAFDLVGDFRGCPRVNISTGKILQRITPQNKSIPYSVLGYADWLYSRRNAIVHGGGKSKFLNNDVAQLGKLYKCKPTGSFRIKLSTISVTAEFYRGVSEMIRRA